MQVKSKLIAQIEHVETGKRGMNVDQCFEIARYANNDTPMAVSLTFNFGFLRGQRAGKAAHKKKKEVPT